MRNGKNNKILRFAEEENNEEKPAPVKSEVMDDKKKKKKEEELSPILEKTEEIKQTGVYEDLSSSEKQVIENLQNKLS